ncbi:hypothetical protein FJZ33_08390 [Candidatus Poribacteria bacterium]|nr:hypothetical protein [Candidatus Poribacteria bacterium]
MIRKAIGACFQSWLVEALEAKSRIEELVSEPEPLIPLPKEETDKARESSLIVKMLKKQDMKRFAPQILSISGRVIMKKQRIHEVILNPLYPMINRIVTAFRTLLEPYGIVISLYEIN